MKKSSNPPKEENPTYINSAINAVMGTYEVLRNTLAYTQTSAENNNSITDQPSKKKKRHKKNKNKKGIDSQTVPQALASDKEPQELKKKTEEDTDDSSNNNNTNSNSNNEENFSVFFGKQSNLDEKIRKLIIDLQNVLKLNNRNPKSPTYLYCKINFLFRFFECTKVIIEKAGIKENEEIYKDINELRKLFIHQLPFFATKPELVQNFVELCTKSLDKELNYKVSVRKQLRAMVNVIINDKLYVEISSLNINPLKDKKDIIAPPAVILEIQATLINLNKIASSVSKGQISDRAIHATTLVLSHYWELVNCYHKFQKSYSKRNPWDYEKYQEFLDFLSSHEKHSNKNKLTMFAKPFRDYIFSHIGYKMVDKEYNCKQLENTSIYNAIDLEIIGVKGVFQFNEGLFLEYASLAKDYLRILQEIDPELTQAEINQAQMQYN